MASFHIRDRWKAGKSRRHPLSLLQWLAIFWILGASMMAIDLGGVYLIWRSENHLSSQVVGYAHAVDSLQSQFYAYDGALNMYVGLSPHAVSLRTATLAAIEQHGAAVQRTLTLLLRTAPAPALHSQAATAAALFKSYQADARLVLRDVQAGHLAAAQSLQEVGNDPRTTRVAGAMQRLDAMSNQRLQVSSTNVQQDGMVLLGLMSLAALLVGGFAIEVRARVRQSFATVNATLTRMLNGDFTAEIPEMALGEFQTLRATLRRARAEVLRVMAERDAVIAQQEDTIRLRVAEADRHSRALEDLLTVSHGMMRDWSQFSQARKILGPLVELVGANGVSLWGCEPWRELFRWGDLPWDPLGPEPLRAQAATLSRSEALWGNLIPINNHLVLVVRWRTHLSGRGLLAMVRWGEQGWPDPDRRLAVLISTQVQLLSDNGSLFREVQQRAVTDSLTGLWNRWQLWDDLHAQSRPLGMALLLVDLDYLKQINDTGGHQAGDDALQRVAQALREAAGAGGKVYRIGGDEFVAVFDRPDAAACQAVFARTAAALAPEFSLSGGIALASGSNAGEPEQLMRRADAALYRAKAAGRGQVALAE
ncbi:MAG: GGDEF domain-containing protein [Thermaerobacter sp.]|nr:GGDEF domain-containing protein [Thermaerobacter sp.]